MREVAQSRAPPSPPPSAPHRFLLSFPPEISGCCGAGGAPSHQITKHTRRGPRGGPCIPAEPSFPKRLCHLPGPPLECTPRCEVGGAHRWLMEGVSDFSPPRDLVLAELRRTGTWGGGGSTLAPCLSLSAPLKPDSVPRECASLCMCVRAGVLGGPRLQRNKERAPRA